MAKWSKNKVDSSTINGGNEFTTQDNLAINELNAVVNNSFYASNIAENVANQLSNLAPNEKIEFKGSNPNLLINGDFRVNQRGQTSYNTTKDRIYTADRWRLSANNETNLTFDLSTMTLSNTGSSVGYLVQMIENPDYLWGKTITISAKVDGVIKSLTLTLPSKPSSSGGVSSQLTLVSGKCNLRLFYYSGSTNAIGFTFDIFANSSVTLEYAKLEIGSVATAFSPRLYAEELALCQRYYWKTTSTIMTYPAYSLTATTVRSILFMPVQLRVNPTITINGTISDGYFGANGKLSYITDLTVTSHNYGQVLLSATGEFELNVAGALRLNNTFELDAEIY